MLYTSISHIGLLREEDKKVYNVPFQNGFPIDPTGGERFLYDFNVAEGDTVYSDLRWSNGMEAYYIVTNLDTVNGIVSHEVLVPSVDSNYISNLRERIVHRQGLVTDPFGAIYGTAMMANRSSSMTRGAEIFNQFFPLDWPKTSSIINCTSIQIPPPSGCLLAVQVRYSSRLPWCCTTCKGGVYWNKYWM